MKRNDTNVPLNTNDRELPDSVLGMIDVISGTSKPNMPAVPHHSACDSASEQKIITGIGLTIILGVLVAFAMACQH